MDLKSGCALEAGLETQAQERRVLWDQALKEIGKIKAFSTKTKTKEIFKGGSKTITIILQQQKLFNYYTRKAQ